MFEVILKVLKLNLRRVLRDFEIYNIFCCFSSFDFQLSSPELVEINASICEESPYLEIQNLSSYDGLDAKGYGILVDGILVCGCWYWYGERYIKDRGFWPLKDKEAKLVQITTAENARGQAFAKKLIFASSQAMNAEGFQCLFARIWWHHVSSERAFVAAGWRRIATVIRFQAPFCSRRFRLQWPPHVLLR